MNIKKVGLLAATLLFGLVLNAQTPEKKACCDKSRTAACENKKSADTKTTASADTKTSGTQTVAAKKVNSEPAKK